MNMREESYLDKMLGMLKYIPDYFIGEEKHLQRNQAFARKSILKIMHQAFLDDLPGDFFQGTNKAVHTRSEKGHKYDCERLHLRLGEVDILFTRFLRADMIQVTEAGMKIASWIDQSIAYRDLMGENSLDLHPLFTYEKVRAICEHSNISEIIMPEELTTTITNKLSNNWGMGDVIFEDQFISSHNKS